MKKTPGHHAQPSDTLVESLEPRMLFAADPITPDNPLWAIPQGTAIIDGVLDDADWDTAFSTTRTQAWQSNGGATIRMMWSTSGIYLSAQVSDPSIWADGKGAGAGNYWDVQDDDSIAFYFDPDDSRDEWFSAGDRAVAVNLADRSAPTDPAELTNTAQPIRRSKYIQGDGAGALPDVEPGVPMPDDILYASSINGTINDASDIDVGWSVEIFMPWSRVNMAMPSHGTTIGMNFDLIFDQDGATRNFVDRRAGTDRFTSPVFVDDQILGVHSSYTDTQAGVHGPVNYAKVMFVDTNANATPVAINDLTTTLVTGYSARLNFVAPTATATGLGHVSSYEIRYATKPITTETEWKNATVFNNRYVPRLAGLAESIRLISLNPATSYSVTVRAVDAAGNHSTLGNSVTFTTQSTAIDPSQGQRVVPSPNGRTLVNELGEPHIVVGDHLGISWNFTRGLYTGDVWDNANQKYQNYYDQPSYEGAPGPYFDLLQSQGVNTMRVFLDVQTLNYQGNPNAPQGLYWLEWNAGQYNINTRNFMQNLLQTADQHDMNLIFIPIYGFYYRQAFDTEVAFNVNKGGPLTDIDNFFQTPATLTQANARVDQLAAWVQQSPYAHRLIGWEAFNEWDSIWTLNPEGDNDPGRETEIRTRAKWIEQFASHIRQVDPLRLVLGSVISTDARGPTARSQFLSRNIDAAFPHFYTTANSEPINSPLADKSIQPAVEQAQLSAYWTSNVTGRRPIISGEWGVSTTKFPGSTAVYNTSSWTQAIDNSIYRTVVWSGLAGGQMGTAMRMSHDERVFAGMLLSTEMRDTQRTFRNFVDSTSLGFDFADFAFDTLDARISVNAGSSSVLSWGIADGQQGLAYILQDLNATTGAVNGAVVTIKGLDRGYLWDIEVWSTDAGVTAAQQTIQAVWAPTGELTFTLPQLTKDFALKFKASPSTGGNNQKVSAAASKGMLVSFALGDDGQPYAIVTDPATDVATIQDISSIGNFRDKAIDMQAFVDIKGELRLAVVDTQRRMWLFQGNVLTGAWNARNLTAELNAPGVVGDLSYYQPSWGTVHIAALDARGNAINYWSPNGGGFFKYSDLTDLIGGPKLSGGLTGYITSWNGLNLAGLNDTGEVIVYWWAPGQSSWNSVNMTTAFNGPTFVGQLDAFVTDWNAMNIVGIDAAGEVQTYWWTPTFQTEPNRWRVSNLSSVTSTPVLTQGMNSTLTADGGFNLFGASNTGDLYALRFSRDSGSWAWSGTNVTVQTGAPPIDFPVAGSALDTRMILYGHRSDADRGLIRFSFMTNTTTWTVDTILNNAI